MPNTRKKQSKISPNSILLSRSYGEIISASVAKPDTLKFVSQTGDTIKLVDGFNTSYDHYYDHKQTEDEKKKESELVSRIRKSDQEHRDKYGYETIFEDDRKDVKDKKEAKNAKRSKQVYVEKYGDDESKSTNTTNTSKPKDSKQKKISDFFRKDWFTHEDPFVKQMVDDFRITKLLAESSEDIKVPFKRNTWADRQKNINDEVKRAVQEAYGEELKKRDDTVAKLQAEDDLNKQYNQLIAGGSDAYGYDYNSYNRNYKPTQQAKEYLRQWNEGEVAKGIKALEQQIRQKYSPEEQMAQDFDDQIKDPNNLDLSNYGGALRTAADARSHFEKVSAFTPQYVKDNANTNAGNIISAQTGYSVLTPEEKQQQKLYVDASKLSNRADMAVYDMSVAKDAVNTFLRTYGFPDSISKIPSSVRNNMEKLGVLYNYYDSKTGKRLGDVDEYYKRYEEMHHGVDEDIKDVLYSKKAPKSNSGISESKLIDQLDSIDELARIESEKYGTAAFNTTGREHEFANKSEQQWADTQRAIEEARKHIQRSKQIKEAGEGLLGIGLFDALNIHNIGYGVLDVFTDVNTYTFDIPKLLSEGRKLELANKVEHNQTLTPAEQSLADALAVSSYVEGQYGGYREIGGYKAGNVAATSLIFMAETFATEGWLTAATKAMAKGGTKVAAQGIKKTILENMATKATAYAERYGTGTFGKFMGRQLVKLPDAAKLLGTQLGQSMIMTGTIQLPQTLATQRGYEAGTVDYFIGDDGHIGFNGFIDRMSSTEAALTAWTQGTIENLSEFSGEWGLSRILTKPIGELAGRAASKYAFVGKLAKASRTVSVMGRRKLRNATPNIIRSAMTKGSAVRNVLNQAHVGGLAGEISEEYTGNFMNRTMDQVYHNWFGIDTRNTEATTTAYDENGDPYQRTMGVIEEINPFTAQGVKTFLDIAGGIALSQVGFAISGGIEYGVAARRYQKAKQLLEAKLKDRAKGYTDAIINAHSDNTSSIYTQVRNLLQDPSEKQALDNYIKALNSYRRFNSQMLDDLESHDKLLHKRAEAQAKANGMTADQNLYHNDIDPVIDLLHEKTLTNADLTEELYQQALQDVGGKIEDLALYFDQNGQTEAAKAVLAEDAMRNFQVGLLKRNESDVITNVENQRRIGDILSADDGNIYIGTEVIGNRNGKPVTRQVFIKRGAQATRKKTGTTTDSEGKTKDVISTTFGTNSDKVLVVDQQGNMRLVESSKIQSIGRQSKKQFVNDAIRSIYEKELVDERQHKFAKQEVALNTPYDIANGKQGRFLGYSDDGRVIYSITQNGVETVQLGEKGKSMSQIRLDWFHEQITSQAEESLSEAERELQRMQNSDPTVDVSNEIRQFLNERMRKQRQDINQAHHGRQITYAEGKTIKSKEDVDKLISVINSYGALGTKALIKRMQQLNIETIPDIDNLPRFQRLIKAYLKGNLTQDELRYILSPEHSKLSEKNKKVLDNMVVNMHGEVKFNSDEIDNSSNTYSNYFGLDISMSPEYMLNEEDEDTSKEVTEGESSTTEETGETSGNDEIPPTPPVDNSVETAESDEEKNKGITSIVNAILHNAREMLRFSKKLQSLRSLQRYANQVRKNVVYGDSYAYFIQDENGNEVLYLNDELNLGGVFADKFKMPTIDRLRTTVYKNLIQAYKDGGIDAFVQQLTELQKKAHKVIFDSLWTTDPDGSRRKIQVPHEILTEIDLTRYITYIKKADNIDRIYDVAECVSKLAVFEERGDTSFGIGQVMHALCTSYFTETFNTDYDTATTNIGGQVVNVKDVMDKDSFDKFLDECSRLKNLYSALGYTIVSGQGILFTANRFDTQRNRNINIVTQADLIAVDKNGKYHIIDIAHSWKGTFDEAPHVTTGELVEFDDMDVRQYIEEQNKSRRITNRLNYTQHLTLMSSIMEECLNTTGIQAELQPWTVYYQGDMYDRGHKVMRGSVYIQAIDNGVGEYGTTSRTPYRIPIVSDYNTINRFASTSEYIADELLKFVQDIIRKLDQNGYINLDLSSLPDDIRETFEADLATLRQDLESYFEFAQQRLITRYDELQEVLGYISEAYDGYVRYAEIAYNANSKAADEIREQQNEEFNDLHLADTPDEYWQQIHDEYTVYRTQMLNLFKQHLRELLIAVNDVDRLGELAYNEQDINNLNVLVRSIDEILQRSEEEGDDFGITEDEYQLYSGIRDWVMNLIELDETQYEEEEYDAPQQIPLPTPPAERPAQQQSVVLFNGCTTRPGAKLEESFAQDGTTLAQAIEEDDFVDNAVFELIITENDNSRFPRLQVITHYKGKTFSPVSITTSTNFNRMAVAAIKNKKDGEIVVINSKPTRSSLQGRSTGEYLTLDKRGYVGENGLVSIYDLDLDDSPSDGVIGLTFVDNDGSISIRTPRKNDTVEQERQNRAGFIGQDGESRRYQVRNESSLSQGTILYRFAENVKHIVTGWWTFLAPKKYSENLSQDRVPIILHRSTFSPEDADFIIDALTGVYSVSGNFSLTDTSCVVDFDGEKVNLGVNILQFVDMLIPVSAVGTNLYMDPSGDPNFPYLQISETGEVTINGKLACDNELEHTFNLNSELGRNNFKNFLTQNVSLHINTRNFGNNRLSLTNLGMLRNAFVDIFSGSSIFTNHKGKTIRFGNSRIAFDEEDFNHENTKKPGVRGITGIGWYVKNGYLLSDSNISQNVSISEAGGIETIDESQLDDVTETESQSRFTEQLITDIMNQYNCSREVAIQVLQQMHGFNKIIKTLNLVDVKPLDKEKAKQDLINLLGEDGWELDWRDTLIEVFTGLNAASVGRITQDSVILSEYAPDGVLFHEAFHRIVELLMTEKQRAKLYKEFRRAMKLDKNTSDKDVAEMLADAFMDYMQNRQELKLSKLILHPFASFKSWVQMIKRAGSIRLLWSYMRARQGKYRNLKPSEEAKKRFVAFNGTYDFTIHGAEYQHIANQTMYDDAIDYLQYLAFYGGKRIAVPWHGGGKEAIKLTRDMFLDQYQSAPHVMQEALSEMLGAHWDTVQEDLAYRMAIFMGNPKSTENKNKEGDNRTDGQSASFNWGQFSEIEQKSDVDDENHSTFGVEDFKDSYEFSQFSKATDKVKFFFSALMNCKPSEDGSVEPVLNKHGLPTLLSTREAFNLVIRRLGDCSNIFDLERKLREYGKTDPILQQISNRLSVAMIMWRSTHDADIEGFLSQLINCVKCASLNVVMAESRFDGGHYSIDIVDPDMVYNHNKYIQDWAEEFINCSTLFFAQDENGLWHANPNINTNIKFTVNQIKSLVQAVLNEQDFTYPVKDKGNVTAKLNKKANKGLNQEAAAYTLKRRLCYLLNKSGLAISVDMLDEYLYTTFNSAGFAAFKEFLNRNAGAFDNFCSKLEGLVDTNGQFVMDEETGNINGDDNTKYLLDCQLLKVMADIKYQYEKTFNHTNQKIAGDNVMNSKAENNLITATADNLSKGSKSSVVKNLRDVAYNLSSDGLFGSIFLKKADGVRKFKFNMLGGFKTPTNPGNDYAKISEREDWTMKAVTLMNGGFTMPSMSGKKTYGYFDLGEDAMPSLFLSKMNASWFDQRYNESKEQWGERVKPLFDLFEQNLYYTRQINFLPAEMYVYDNSQVDQLLEYAYQELAAVEHYLSTRQNVKNPIKNFDKGLSFKTILGNVVKKSEDGKFYENVVTGAKIARIEVDEATKKENLFIVGTMSPVKIEEKFVRQGGRFSALNVICDKNNYIELNRTVDEKGMYMDEKKCLGLAKEHFFNRREGETEAQRRDRQRAQVREALSRQTDKQLSHLIDLGLITETSAGVYKNNGLDHVYISRYQSIIMKYAELRGINIAPEVVESMAIKLYVGDVTARGIISNQEFERNITGRIAYFAWWYDEKGHCIDMTKDWHKRMGGLVSTGVDNNTGIFGEDMDDAEYNCCTIKNDKDPSAELEELAKRIKAGEIRQKALELKLNEFTESQYEEYNKYVKDSRDAAEKNGEDITTFVPETRDLFISRRRKEITDEVDNTENTDELQQYIEAKYPDAWKLLSKIIKGKTDSFKKVDIADGAAYMSDEMCETLLRMCGNYDSKIQRAFKILRGEEVDGRVYTTKDIRQTAEAYQLVMQTVIGAQKYTAYGFRYENGNMVPYYNKMALFPIFKCMSSGRIGSLYDYMHTHNVQIAHIESAIKVGIEGSTKFDFEHADELDIPIHKLRYADLRKQFNTDPKGEESRNIGTQMTKVVMLALCLTRNYGGRRGVEIRDSIMSSMNALALNGYSKMLNKYFTKTERTNSKGETVTEYQPNARAFSKLLVEQLRQRNADPDLIEAVSINERTGDFNIPLSALSEMSWVQSIISSMINKEVIDIDAPGTAFYQRSVWGMEGGQFFTEKDFPEPINNGKKLKVWNEGNTMDCVLSIDFFHEILKLIKVKRKVPKTVTKYGVTTTMYDETEEIEVTADKLSFEELKQLLIDNGIIGPNAKANLVGYRIPTQAISSIHALRCVDVLPVLNETIILPAEFTSITGSDFDIDKLFLTTKHYTFDNHTGKLTDNFKTRKHKKYVKENGTTVDPYEVFAKVYEMHPDIHEDLVNAREMSGNEGATLESFWGKTELTKDKNKTQYYKEALASMGLSEKNTIMEDVDISGKYRKEYHQNNIIDNYLTLLSDEKAFNRLNGSIDMDTAPIKDIVADLYPDSGETLASYDAMSLRKQVLTKLEFVSGKFGIGPYALNNNNHILCMLYGVDFDPENNKFLADLGLTTLSKDTDRNGRSISSWLSGLINAHVDVEKDPYIAKLNVNSYTYNLTNLLIRTGFSDETFYFTTQPIMKEMAKAYINAAGVYMVDEESSTFEAQQKALDDYITQFVIQNNLIDLNDYNSRKHKKKNETTQKYEYTRKELFKQFEKDFEKKYGVSVNNVIKELFKHGNTTLYEIAKEDAKKRPNHQFKTISGLNLSHALLQMIVAIANENLQHPAKKLADVVKYSKIDTKKHGKTIEEQRVYLEGYESTFGSKQKTFTSGINKLASSSYIQTKTILATRMMQKIFSPFFIEATDNAYSVTKLTLARMGQPTNKDVTVRQAIMRSFIATIKCKYFFGVGGYCEQHGIKKRDLFVGNKSIYSRLIRLKSKIVSDPEYSYLLNEDGTIDNYLLSHLFADFKNDAPGSKYDDYRFVKVRAQLDGESTDGQSIKQAWYELLNDGNHPELQEFARDLIVYAYAYNGDAGGAYDLCKFIPNSVKGYMNEDKSGFVLLNDQFGTFAEYMANATNWMNEGYIPDPDETDEDVETSAKFYSTEQDYIGYEGPIESDYQDIITNNANHKSGKFVLTISKEEAYKLMPFDRKGDPIYGTPSIYAGLYIGSNNRVSTYTFSPYIRMYTPNGYQLYKQIATGNLAGVQFPIYAAISQKGAKFKKGYRLQEYGEQRNVDVINNENLDKQVISLTDEDIQNIGRMINQRLFPVEYAPKSKTDAKPQKRLPLSVIAYASVNTDVSIGNVYVSDNQFELRLHETSDRYVLMQDTDARDQAISPRLNALAQSGQVSVARFKKMSDEFYNENFTPNQPQRTLSSIVGRSCWINKSTTSGGSFVDDQVYGEIISIDKKNNNYILTVEDAIGKKHSVWLDADLNPTADYILGIDIDFNDDPDSEENIVDMKEYFMYNNNPQLKAIDTNISDSDQLTEADCIYIPNHPELGYVELIKDESGRYNVTFNFAKDIDDVSKNLLIDAMIYAIPMGAEITYSNTITEQDLAIMNKLDELSSDNLIKVDTITLAPEFKLTPKGRLIVTKKSGLLKDGKYESVEVPVWKKSGEYIPSSPLNTPTAPIEQLNNNIQLYDSSLDPIDIWYSSDENADLSNMGEKPFYANNMVVNGRKVINTGYFNTVEAAFHNSKLSFIDDPQLAQSEYIRMHEAIRSAKTPYDAQTLGRLIRGLNVQAWDAAKREIMKNLIRDAFNSSNVKAVLAKQHLIETGMHQLTHKNASKEYREMFPEVLMEVRAEFLKQQLTQPQLTVSVSSISDKTATNGVTIDTRLKSYTDEETKRIARAWLKNNPNGIVAFRLSKDYATPQMANAGAIGNPFNWNDPKYKDSASQLFMDWLITGNNFGEPLATEEYRLAIILKLLSIDTPNILYYKELNKPSHATVLGYLINHKELLNNQLTLSTNPMVHDSVETQKYIRKRTKEKYLNLGNFLISRLQKYLGWSVAQHFQEILDQYDYEGLNLEQLYDELEFFVNNKLTQEVIPNELLNHSGEIPSALGKAFIDNAVDALKNKTITGNFEQDVLIFGQRAAEMFKEMFPKLYKDGANVGRMRGYYLHDFYKNQSKYKKHIDEYNKTHVFAAKAIQESLKKLSKESKKTRFRLQLIQALKTDIKNWYSISSYEEKHKEESRNNTISWEQALDEIIKSKFLERSKIGVDEKGNPRYSAKLILEQIAQTSTEYAELAKFVLNNVPGDLSVTIKSRSGSSNVLATYVYDDDKNTYPEQQTEAFISINKPNFDRFLEDPFGIFMHEIVHSVTAQWLDKNEEFVKAIDDYIEYINNHIGHHPKYGIYSLMAPYGLKDPYEFIAEYFANQEFRDFLRDIPAMDKKQFKNIFEQILDFILNLFSGGDKNAYEQIKPVMEHILNAGLEYTEYHDMFTDNFNRYEQFINNTQYFTGRDYEQQTFKNSLFRGLGYDPEIDENGNLLLHTNWDQLGKVNTLSFDSTRSGAEHYGHRAARNPYIIELDRDYLDTVLPRGEYNREDVESGKGFQYDEYFNEVRLSFSGKLAIPNDKYKIYRDSYDVKYDNLHLIFNDIIKVIGLEELSEIQEYWGASELEGRIHPNDIKDINRNLDRIGEYKGHKISNILYNTYLVSNPRMPGSPVYHNSKDIDKYVKEGIIKEVNIKEHVYFVHNANPYKSDLVKLDKPAVISHRYYKLSDAFLRHLESIDIDVKEYKKDDYLYLYITDDEYFDMIETLYGSMENYIKLQDKIAFNSDFSDEAMKECKG